MNQPLDILIVDDTPANLRLLSQLLTEHGYKVRAALNGARAIDAAHAQVPDLILLDIMMPEMDGYTVCERLKALPRTRDVPVIFLSALGEADDKVKAFAVGGVDYMTKPFEPREVLARVQTHLTLRNLTRKLETANAELATHWRNWKRAMRSWTPLRTRWRTTSRVPWLSSAAMLTCCWRPMTNCRRINGRNAYRVSHAARRKS